MNASLNEKLRAVKWGEYKLGDLFEINPTKYYRLANDKILSKSGITPLVSNASIANGVMGFSNLNPLNKGNSLSCSDTTLGAETMYYQKNDYIGYQHIQSLMPKFDRFNSAIAFFIISASHAATSNGQYDYGHKFNRKSMRKTVIFLPICDDGSIDFDFMESFIAELEAERVAELSAYLTVSGLDNYELSNNEMAIIERYKKHQIPFSEFEFIKIFNNIKQGRRLKKDDQLPGDIPFVMSGTTNTGVIGYISNPVARFPKNSITIDIFGNSFYRNYDFGAGDDTGVYWNTEKEYSRTCMLFFAAAMGRALRGKYSYGKKLRSSQSIHFKMQLPTKDGKPDYDAMAALISAVQKLVIKDVVLYADRKIEKTKDVTKR